METRPVKTSDSHPINLQFVNFTWGQNQGRIGITFAPGKKQPNGFGGNWHRDITKDLQRIKQEFNVSTLVCLLQKHEFKKLKIQNELEECERIGIKPYNFPIVDNSVPSNQQQFKKFVREIVQGHLKIGKNVVVHCMGGLGRAPTFAASCLIYSGVKPVQAIEIVKKARKDSLTSTNQVYFLQNLRF